MYSYPRAALYAILLWAVTLLVAFFVYPLRTENLLLFTSIRTLAVALLSMFFTVMYFRDVQQHFLRDGMKLGAMWMVISLALDQGPYVWGSMHLSFADYLADAGSTYLLCPIITTGAGLLLSAERLPARETRFPAPGDAQGEPSVTTNPSGQSKSL
jgi:hypothetical protein